eukprot:CAMPEP_0181183920 /NCGR_PEP_ID=MMETSP1096-20121128/8689_1 /TAXON_ID=156174 ORGANISM="Chrysochromulina ericina, Strain CCMP281" /NCGR_SAMPLE_ID=MMETSP1096 /ASSEMBLY_ACC=CAM_ASM_000453 /LENGTH=135 /DNA_ID=CAMNT_0023272645 /DNA_START=151 /DNA_END=558 /DNA_ORIENTATION=+
MKRVAEVEKIMSDRGYLVDEAATRAIYVLAAARFLRLNTRVYTPQTYPRRQETECVKPENSSILPSKTCQHASSYACMHAGFAGCTHEVVIEGSGNQSSQTKVVRKKLEDRCGCVSHCECPAVLRSTPLLSATPL